MVLLQQQRTCISPLSHAVALLLLSWVALFSQTYLPDCLFHESSA